MPMSAARLSIAGLAALAVAVAMTGRPLTAPLTDKIDIAEMTWLEVRDARERGYTSVIVPSGGLEQNGPHMAIGKHDWIVAWTARAIAAELGRTLVAPVVSYVPQGDYDPPTMNMAYPGTIGVTDEAFSGTLEGIARSLKTAGFKTICFIADHGPSQEPQRKVAARLDREWKNDGIRVVSVDDYYALRQQDASLMAKGESAATMGDHAGLADTSELMAVRPEAVTLARLADNGLRMEPNGASGDPSRATAESGRALLTIKIDAALRQIRAVLAGRAPPA